MVIDWWNILSLEFQQPAGIEPTTLALRVHRSIDIATKFQRAELT